MKRIVVLLSFAVMAAAAPAMAGMNASQQTCTSNAECTLVSTTCGNACASVPINQTAKKALEPTLRQQCGGTLPEETDVVCHMNPPLQPACINNRCTIGYAFENNGGPGDYQTSQAPAGQYEPVALKQE